jgi:protein TonB
VRRAILASGAAATLLHAYVLYGLDLYQPATPLPPAPAPLVVELVASAPEPAPVPDPPVPPEPPRPEREPEPKRAAKRPTPKPKLAPPERTASASPPAPADPTPQGGAPAAVPSLARAEPSQAPLPSSVPRYRNTPEPEYPPAARRERQEGVVLLAVDVGTNGRPTAVAVQRSSGFPLLDAAALAGVRRWRFEPARAAGVPVASRVEVPIRFSLSE